MKKNNPTSLNSLRAQAEDILKSRHPITGMPLSEAEIYELQVSQIELELRNKELIQVNGCVTGFNTEQKYHYMFESNPQPMWIYDLETLAFLEVNDAAVHHYGYSKEEFRGMTLKDIRPEEDVERLKKDVEATNKIYNSAGEWRHR
jgi:PAS domain-containing protein